MINHLNDWHRAEYAFDGLAVLAGLLIAVPCFAVLTAPFWSGL